MTYKKLDYETVQLLSSESQADILARDPFMVRYVVPRGTPNPTGASWDAGFMGIARARVEEGLALAPVRKRQPSTTQPAAAKPKSEFRSAATQLVPKVTTEDYREALSILEQAKGPRRTRASTEQQRYLDAAMGVESEKDVGSRYDSRTGVYTFGGPHVVSSSSGLGSKAAADRLDALMGVSGPARGFHAFGSPASDADRSSKQVADRLDALMGVETGPRQTDEADEPTAFFAFGVSKGADQ